MSVKARCSLPRRLSAAGGLRVAAFLLAACALALPGVLPPAPSSAQEQKGQPPPQQQAQPQPAPSLSNSVTAAIDKEGYTLKPKGIAVDQWPTARFDFSVEKKDASGRPVVFSGLKASDIQVKLDGRPVAVNDSDLKLTDSEPTSVLLMVDASGSMTGAKTGVNKLTAAKAALNTFVASLGPKDRVALGAFDEEPFTLADPTTDKELLRDVISKIEVNPEHSKYTRLYTAIDAALRQAQAVEPKITNVIFISDGWEDSPESRKLSGAQLDEFKREWEKKIADRSRDTGIRVFTIAIGDEQGTGLAYVDRLALSNISKGANGGDAAYICVPQPGTAGHCAEEITQGVLEERLEETLENIRQSFRYGYSLNIRLDPNIQRDDAAHKLWIAATVGTQPRIQLPVEYGFNWAAGARAPDFKPPVVLQPAVFIQTAPPNLTAAQAAQLYVLMVSILVLLGVMPPVIRRVVRATQSSGAVTTVGGRSGLVGHLCPNEKTDFGVEYIIKEGDAVIVCPKCNTVHHLGCWIFNRNQCMNRTCEFEMAVPPQVLSKFGYEEVAH